MTDDRSMSREMGRKAAGGAVSAVVRWGVGFLLVAALGTGAGVWAASDDDEDDSGDSDDRDRQTSEVDD